MMKVIALCCVLLQANAACTPGAGGCDAMDESALVQKDMALAQKRLQEPTDVDRQTVAKHLSEGLSLHYLTEGANAKLEQAKRLTAPLMTTIGQIEASNRAYGEGKHTKEDWDKWHDEVTESMSKAVSLVSSESKAAETDLAKIKEELNAALDDMEAADNFAELVSKYAVAYQLISQGNMMSKSLESGQETFRMAFERNKEHSKDGFDAKVYGKTNQAMTVVLNNMKSMLTAMNTISKNKMKEVEDAASEFTSRSVESLNDAVWQLISVDKHTARTTIAQQAQQGFTPIEQGVYTALQAYASSKRGEEDSKAFRTAMESAMEKTVALVEGRLAADVKEATDKKASVMASLNNLPDEENFAAKLMEFATLSGTARLGKDILTPVKEQQTKITEAFDAYDAEAKAGNADKAFGEIYKTVIQMLIQVKTSLASQSNVQTYKMEQLQSGQIKLHSFLKQ